MKLLKQILCIFFISLLLYPSTIYGDGASNEPKVLVVYSTETGNITANVRLLDMLISHFTQDITFVSNSEFKNSNLQDITHLFYYGETEDTLVDSFVSASFSGTIVAIGDNVGQLPNPFHYIKVDGITQVSAIKHQKSDKTIPIEQTNVHLVLLPDKNNTEVLISGTHEDQTFPLFVQHDNSYYYASKNLFPPASNAFADILHDIFAVNHSDKHQAFLRLEDVHPRLEGEIVMETAKFLKEQNIPYLVSVSPVYTDPNTGTSLFLADNKQLVEALLYMQNNGASIILHGYTDQSGTATTGDGFEFWDIEKNSPIFQDPSELKKQEDFSTTDQYQDYLNQIEQGYIQDRLEKGIKALVDLELYPIAFEAPHYAMSQHGYQVVSDYFSTYVGQLQLTDDDWRVMAESPNMTSPSFLHGMQLVPETIRYVRYEEPASIDEMNQFINDLTVVRDGIIGGFYHPFLGVDDLKKLVTQIEKTPNLEWIDLKEHKHTVETNDISITTEDGEVQVKLTNQPLEETQPDPDETEEQSDESPAITQTNTQNPNSEVASDSTGFPMISSTHMQWIVVGACVTIFIALLSILLFRNSRTA
ncbi:DUF2334 domain-containing protein [Aquibacillus koreensis]|uniref:DUF2334 domain-containing protein n=1 Tax=Aquibacillus koreensis TaxID=279446 RepID=A0A9X4AK22_9BACI|nr:DUF2334 domain-containing protein [Aquibacillus koreensis]MCT2536668.1 DUF2334 domain-containing protein [Aquibacillus koreensis]MDC3422621.1 DUF2334 domain-containing protein [Aquibacillus koreensis]